MALCRIHLSAEAILITLSILSNLSSSHSISSNTLPVSTDCSTWISCYECNVEYNKSNCFWRQSECHKLETSELPVPQRNIVCPPEVRDFVPKSGPLAGGTLLTIYGVNFGKPPTDGRPNEDMMSILVGNRKCEVLYRNNVRAECKIEEALPDFGQNIPGLVDLTIEVKYFERFDYGYYIDGKAQAEVPFNFVQPEVSGIYPSYGPYKGGTYVMIYGKNLNISHGANVAFGSYRCEKVFTCESMVICRTVSISSNQTNIDPLPVNVSIDSWQMIFSDDVRTDSLMKIHNGRREQIVHWTNDFNFQYFVQEINLFLTGKLKLLLGRSFRYLPNPEVEKPTNLATVESGGMSLQFKGKYLGSSKYPVMSIYMTKEFWNKPDVQMLCTVHSEETILDCLLEPSRTTPVIRDLFDKKLHYFLHFDDFVNENDFSLEVFPDPVFNHSVKVLPGEVKILEFMGWHLNPALPYNIILKTRTDFEIPCDVEPRIDEQERHLWCRVNRPPEVINRYTYTDLEVSISVGTALDFQPGYVRFVDESISMSDRKLPWIWILIPVFGVPVIIFLLYKWYQNRAVRKLQQEVFESAKWKEDLEGIFVRNSPETRDFRSLFSILLDRSMLIDPNLLIVNHRLGSGNYGMVYKAVYEPPSLEPGTEEISQLEVALKVQNRDSGVFCEFIAEAQVMLEFNHPNVMYLVGVTLHENRKPAIVLPFMDGLDLKSFVTSEELKIEDLLCFGLQIANGMTYLSELNIIHRDLALRNCMIQRGNPWLVRVADFGLTRVTTQNYYQRSRNGLPFLWMAPEALKRFRFSIKSDVYSYGITLWELMTRGKTPFEFFTADELIMHLDDGHRLPMPNGCPDLIYAIMGKCWMHDPDDRPVFRQIYDELGRAIDGIDNLENAEAHRYENSFFARYSRNREFIFDYRQPQTRDILNQAEESILRYKIGTVFDFSRELREENASGSGRFVTDYSFLMADNEHPPEYLSFSYSSNQIIDNQNVIPEVEQSLQRTPSLPVLRNETLDANFQKRKWDSNFS